MASTTPIKVAVIGASGRTGESIIDGLLASETTKFDVTAITRPSSLESEGVQALRARGVRIAALDLRAAPKDELVRAFAGLDVLVSAIYALALEDQVGILDAVKEAKVGRFVPCFFGTPAPRGVQKLLDTVRYTHPLTPDTLLCGFVGRSRKGVNSVLAAC